MKKIFIPLWLTFGLVLFSVSAHAALPVPDIKANNSNGPVSVLPTQTVEITVSLDPGTFTGTNAEWWIAVDTGAGWYFLNASLNWGAASVPIGWIALSSLSPYTILNATLPLGKYIFYFALDSKSDGLPNNIVVSDEVAVTVGAAVEVSANPSRILADGAIYADIVAYVTSDNAPVQDGTSVAFATDAGILSASQATTSGGYAQVTLTGDTPGVANVTATALTVSSRKTPVTFEPTVKSIAITANPDTILGDGTECAAITATLKDGFGNPSPRGTKVTFTTTLGEFSNQLQTIEVFIDNGSGVASSSLYGAKTFGVANLQASAFAGAAKITSKYVQVNVVGVFEIVLPDPAGGPFSAATMASDALALTSDNRLIAFKSTSPPTIIRGDGGDFLVDGFSMGDTIMVGGSTSNDGTYTVGAVAVKTLTLVTNDVLTGKRLAKLLPSRTGFWCGFWLPVKPMWNSAAPWVCGMTPLPRPV